MMKSIFQSPEWEEFRVKTGYQKSYRVEGILVLQKNLPLGRSMLYSPMVSDDQVSDIRNQDFIKQVKKIARESKSIFYRLELDTPTSSNSELLDSSFQKSFEEMQPEHTLILDISKSTDEILAQMKQKGRYNIKIARRNNVEVNYSNKLGTELDQFYELYSTMAKRHGISYRSKKYFEGLIEILGEKDYARTYIATYDIDDKKIALAAMIAIFYKDTAIYLYGGSADEFRNVMAPYILHWQVIKDAKETGCKKYDFFGIAPNDDPKHPWAGVTRFKEQFGGEKQSILGSFDLPFRPLEYAGFKLIEKIRRH